MTEKTMELEKKEEQTLTDAPVTRVRRSFKPRVDLYEGNDVIMLAVDLPGVRTEDVDITVEKDRLTVTGTKTERAPEDYRVVYSEFCHGDYKRSFILSNDIDRDNIKASFDNGVLRLTLPKVETAKARKITLQNVAS